MACACDAVGILHCSASDVSPSKAILGTPGMFGGEKLTDLHGDWSKKYVAYFFLWFEVAFLVVLQAAFGG